MKSEDFLKPQYRIYFIRKANELFNKKDYINAEKLFKLTKYIDGLIRLGDLYLFKKGNILKALELYKFANYQKRIDETCILIAKILSNWIKQDKHIENK
ncbi:MAG: tetratricopeptide repeat protein [Spirochaetes bacterium]|nr:tetratricopeptide repeat protein [Spirochaetota bacterium]